MVLVEASTLGEGWLAVSRTILESGDDATWGGAPTREVALLTLAVERPDSRDALIAELGDPDWLDWMHRNFFVHEEVPELGRARSYAQRLFDYGAGGRDQIAWVVERLRADPECRDAAITTLEPLVDTTYVPCVSMLDFWLRGPRSDSSSWSTRTDSTSARRPTATLSSSPTCRSASPTSSAARLEGSSST